MLVGGKDGGWLVSRRGLGRSGKEEGEEALPEDSSWPGVFSRRPQTPIPLPGQVQLPAGPVIILSLPRCHYPIQGQKLDGAVLSLLVPLVKYLDCWAEGPLFL